MRLIITRQLHWQKINTVIILSDVHFGWQMHQFYAKNAFLHGKLEEEVLGIKNLKKSKYSIWSLRCWLIGLSIIFLCIWVLKTFSTVHLSLSASWTFNRSPHSSGIFFTPMWLLHGCYIVRHIGMRLKYMQMGSWIIHHFAS